MGVDIQTYRRAIGSFSLHGRLVKSLRKFVVTRHGLRRIVFALRFESLFTILLTCGDIETNPGPDKNTNTNVETQPSNQTTHTLQRSIPLLARSNESPFLIYPQSPTGRIPQQVPGTSSILDTREIMQQPLTEQPPSPELVEQTKQLSTDGMSNVTVLEESQGSQMISLRGPGSQGENQRHLNQDTREIMQQPLTEQPPSPELVEQTKQLSTDGMSNVTVLEESQGSQMISLRGPGSQGENQVIGEKLDRPLTETGSQLDGPPTEPNLQLPSPALCTEGKDLLNLRHAIQLKSPVPEEMANVPEEGNVHSLNVRKQHENHDVIQEQPPELESLGETQPQATGNTYSLQETLGPPGTLPYGNPPDKVPEGLNQGDHTKGTHLSAILITGYDDDPDNKSIFQKDVDSIGDILKNPAYVGIRPEYIFCVPKISLEDAIKLVRDNDCIDGLFIYYSGHNDMDKGIQIDDNRFVSKEDLEKLYKILKEKDIVLVWDCCFSEQLKSYSPKIRVQIGASGPDERSRYDVSGSIFTKIFIHCLKGIGQSLSCPWKGNESCKVCEEQKSEEVKNGLLSVTFLKKNIMAHTDEMNKSLPFESNSPFFKERGPGDYPLLPENRSR